MADPKTRLPLSRQSIIDAHELIQPHIHFTPVLTNKTFNGLACGRGVGGSGGGGSGRIEGRGGEGMRVESKESKDEGGKEELDKQLAQPKMRLWFKCENFQRVGAFKVRGAFHAIKRLEEEMEGKDGKGEEEGNEGWRERGVVTHSSGNHAQALALAARELGIPAHIVMPEISTPSKIAATKGYGANVRFSGSTSVEREKMVEEVIKETGAKLVPPYDHPDIIAGQGTMGLELQEQVRNMLAEKGEKKGLDVIITPCGGGGMLSGVALSCEGTGIKVFGAEPSFQGADDCTRGFKQGKRIESVKSLTIADGLRTPVGKIPWSVIFERRLVEGMFSVGEEEIRRAMRLVWERMKVVVEPSAVVGLAVVLWDEEFRSWVEERGRELRKNGEDGALDVGIVFSGGNVGVDGLGKLFGGVGKEGEGKGKGEEGK